MKTQGAIGEKYFSVFEVLRAFPPFACVAQLWHEETLGDIRRDGSAQNIHCRWHGLTKTREY